MSDKVVKLFENDRRLSAACMDLVAFIYQRCDGMELASVLGILRLAEAEILQDQMEDV